MTGMTGEQQAGERQEPLRRVRAALTTRPALLAGSLSLAFAVTSTTWQGAGAVFRSSGTNGTNAYAAGTVVISDSQSGTKLFNVTGLQPGSTGTACLTVTYSGSLSATVKLRAAITGTLGTYLTVTLARGTGTCASFGSVTTLYNGLASTLATSNGTYASGLGAWAVTGGLTTALPYRLTYTLNADNAAVSTSSDLTLTWEAQTP